MRFTKFAILALLVLLMTGLLPSCFFEKLFIGNDQDAKLFDGMLAKNKEEILEAINDGANINHLSGFHLPSSNPLWMTVLGDGNDMLINLLINNGADVNISNKGGQTLLMFYANNVNYKYCELLLKHGAIVNKKDKKGNTALDYLLTHNERGIDEKNANHIITLLLDNGAELKKDSFEKYLQLPVHTEYSILKRVTEDAIKAGFKTGFNPSLEAAILGDSKRLKTLIQQNQINKADENKILFSTAAFGNAETFQLLIEKGANIKSKDDNLRTPLIIASCYGNIEIVKYLLGRNADIEETANGLYGSMSALDFAVENNQYAVVEYLIKQGAKLKAASRFTDSTDVLRVAIQTRNIKIIQLILSSGYDLDETRKNSAFALASDIGNVEIMNYFLGLGADINGKDYNGYTPLHYAKDLDTAKFLVENGVNVNREYVEDAFSIPMSADMLKYYIKNGWNINATPKYEDGSVIAPALFGAVSWGDYDMVKILVENGADINYIIQDIKNDNNRVTALMTASYFGSKNILKYLIEKGADINYQNRYGQTSLMFAASNRRLDNVKMLVQNKADIKLKDKDGKTALDYAKEKGYTDIVNYLKNNK